jgi:predicted dehydrogenase
MSPLKALRWGLIGCGDIARRRVAPALRDLESCRLVSVNRADTGRLEEFAREFGADKWISDWHQLVADPDIDAVYIATPVVLHHAMTLEAAACGKHVLCEKPMALSDTECKAMITACNKRNVRLGIAYYRHFYPTVRRAHAIIQEGLIGDIKIIQINAFSHFDRKPGEPRYWLLEKKKSGGGPMMDFGCHRIEVMLYLLGPVIGVHAEISNLCFQREVEDTAIAHLEFKSGARGLLTVTHTVPDGQDTLDIYGTRGSVHIPVLNRGTLILRTESGDTSEQLPPHENLHSPLIENFARAVLQDRLPEVTGETGLEVNKILTKIYRNTF